MIKAGSLYYAIMICVLVGICCAAFMLTSHYARMHAMIVQSQTELLTTNQSAMNYFLGKGEGLKNGPLDILDNGMLSKASMNTWGFLKVLNVQSYFKKDTISRHALVAANTNKKVALYLADNEKPLQMVGKAKIIGAVFLPKKGIKKGYITKQSFSRFNFLEGDKQVSSNHLPGLTEIFVCPDTTGLSKRFSTEIEDKESVYNGFDKETIHIEITADALSGKSIYGNVIITSKDSLFIRNDNQLEDVILSAPIVVFEKGFKGTVQVFAKERVELENEVILKYPSAIYMDQESGERKEVILREDSTLLGMIIVNDNESANHIGLVSIEKNAELVGVLYCKGSTELKGNVVGSVYTDNFYLKTTASTYENYIEDGTIDLKSLHNNFLGASFMNEDENRTVYGIIKLL